jgi:hypothetical protein
MKEVILEVIKVLKEYTEPPAKSQQQWKLFSIVKDVQKNNRKAPPWVGRGKNQDKQMISMMASKIPSSEVDKFLSVDINSLPVYVDGESKRPSIDKMYKDGEKAKAKKSSKVGPHSKMSDKPVKKGEKRGSAGRPKKYTPRDINKALKKTGNLNKSKSKTAKWLKNRGYTKKHQDAAKKYGDWSRTESLKSIRDIIVEEVRKKLDEAMSSTERMRRYNKKHPEKVKQNLKKTQDDRVARNKAHNNKTEEYGTELMRNKDVHHPNGVKNGKEKIVKKDHGRDIKK